MGRKSTNFNRQLREFQDYLSSLHDLPQLDPEKSDGQNAEVIEILSTAVEELRVAGEELLVQNEQLAEARDESERDRERYRQLFDFAPDGYIVTDPNGVIQAANRAAGELLGVDPAFLVRKPLTLYIESQDLREFLTRISDLQEMKAFRDWEIRMAPRKSIPIDVSIDAVSEPGDIGNPLNIRWMIRDITERKLMRRELYESEARYQTIFHGIDLGILLLDLEGNILTSNPALLRMIGTTQTELRGKTLFNLIQPANIKESKDSFREVISGERDHHSAERRFFDQQHQEIAVKLTLSLARDQNGDPHYVIGIIENITAQKQMEAELVEVERRMVDVGEAERLHLAQELHDGPLQDLYAVMYQLKLLQEVPSSTEKTAQDMDRIRGMLQHIIDLLRTTTGDLRPPTLAYFGLSKAIQSHAETLQEVYPGLDFQLELTDDQNKLSQRVRMGLFRIYQHCIINVVRHAQATQVVIRFELTSTRVMLEIQDNGIGFRVPKQWIDLVREGHFGLVGAAERAVSIGGDIKIRSVEGEGTIVRVVVPRREEDQKQKARFPFQVSDLSPGGDDWT